MWGSRSNPCPSQAPSLTVLDLAAAWHFRRTPGGSPLGGRFGDFAQNGSVLEGLGPGFGSLCIEKIKKPDFWAGDGIFPQVEAMKHPSKPSFKAQVEAFKHSLTSPLHSRFFLMDLYPVSCLAGFRGYFCPRRFKRSYNRVESSSPWCYNCKDQAT